VYRFIIYGYCLLFVAGCAGKTGDDFRVSLGLVSAYEAAQKAFHQGQIMQARERLLTIKKDDKDYHKARTFLKKEVEPARLKLLRYYARKGKAEEKKGNWAKAEEAYAMAAELSQQPQALKTYQKNMNLKVRQLRFDSLYQQRKKEDKIWLDWQNAYIPPQGLLGDDRFFADAREDIDQATDKRIETAWKRAKMYRDEDKPEMAWLYADSYLRLYPGDKKAQDLRNAMATALPKGFRLPQSKDKEEKAKRVKPVQVKASAKHVRLLMKQGKWMEAKSEALNLRKEGHADADTLLANIDANIASLAEDAYQKGNLAFRNEKIDAAVQFWQQAVDLKPNEQTYVDSLRRGKQIQERLNALKAKGEQ